MQALVTISEARNAFIKALNTYIFILSYRYIELFCDPLRVQYIRGWLYLKICYKGLFLTLYLLRDNFSFTSL